MPVYWNCEGQPLALRPTHLTVFRSCSQCSLFCDAMASARTFTTCKSMPAAGGVESVRQTPDRQVSRKPQTRWWRVRMGRLRRSICHSIWYGLPLAERDFSPFDTRNLRRRLAIVTGSVRSVCYCQFISDMYWWRWIPPVKYYCDKDIWHINLRGYQLQMHYSQVTYGYVREWGKQPHDPCQMWIIHNSNRKSQRWIMQD